MSSPPPWQPQLQEDLEVSLKEIPLSVCYSLSTLDGPNPTVRTVVHRGFANERRSSEKDDWSSNPRGIDWDLMVVTTDVRSPKAQQILASPPNHGVPSALSWWLIPTNSQYRISGPIYLLPPPNHPHERLRHFRKLTPDLRASFLRPAPGGPLKEGDGKNWPETLKDDLEAEGEEKELVKKALENFALIVVMPNRVDYVNLKCVPNVRKIFTKTDKSWKIEDVVP
ncbi:hypothetical protein BT69DRAFT_1280027 [Atractiella rhizophila]|nr:hypothetical protein BT69DRAFT_1280027 [Atractiella rhizophila]